MKRLLICDEDAASRELVREILADLDVEVELCPDAHTAMARCEERGFDVVVSDITFENRSGLEVLKAVKAGRPQTEVILMSAAGTLDMAVDAIRLGAFDFVSKPFDAAEVRRAVERALDPPVPAQTGTESEPSSRMEAELLGSSPKMLAVYKSIALVADAKTSVLLQGESGTGKELVARAIHAKGSRNDGRFVPVNCGALTESLLESELFGYVKGAFTGASSDRDGLFQAASGGTIFLDEISNMSAALQVKLLRVLQQAEYTPVGGTETRSTDVRVIAASNRDLESLVQEGQFREDLLYRLNVVTIQLPALRERPEDIPKLLGHFVHRIRSAGSAPLQFTPEALETLIRYPWPGNVRELENTVERLALFARGRRVEARDLPSKFRDVATSAADGLFQGLPPLATIEKRYLEHVLHHVGGNRTRAAEVLGVDRRTLYRMLERFGLSDTASSRSKTD